jgi:CheY-like chemotaxis protein
MISFGNVLVVNDVEINLIVAQELFESYRLQVDTANSGFKALDKVRSGGVYDIIFMDIKMPGMDGVQTTREIREFGYSGVIVAWSGNEINDCEYDIKSEFDGFLFNPIDEESLEKLFREFIPMMRKAEAPQSESDRSRLMRAFKRDAEKAISELRELMKSPQLHEPLNHSGILKTFTSIFHSMKTALANTACEKESKLAFALEKAGSNGDVAYITGNIDSFIAILEDLTESVQTSGGAVAGESDLQESEDVRKQMELIRAACDSYDIGKVESLFDKMLECRLKSVTRDFLESMRDIIYSDSDFDTVSEKIGEYLEGGAANA